MRNVSKYLKQLFESGERKAVKVTIENATTSGLTFDETQIIANAFSIDRYCVTGNAIEVGSAVAAELALTLNNANGDLDDIAFEGSVLSVEIGIAGVANSYIPCGKFTVDEPPRKNKTISLRALDFMMLFDNKADVSKLSFSNPEVLVKGICNKCGVTLSSKVVFSDFANYSKALTVPTTEVTYRQLLQWACQILGVCAYMDGKGELMLSWYTNVVDDIDGEPINISKSVRYSGELSEKDIEITGVVIKRGEGDVIKGNSENAVIIENNQLIDSTDEGVAAIANAIYSKVNGLKYRPYECSCLPMPYLYPLDKIAYADKDGNIINTVITNHTFGLNSVSNLSAKGETAQQKSYSKSKGVTKGDIDAAVAEAMKGVDLKTDHFYVMYSHYPKGRDDAGNISWSEEPENDSLYIGTFVSSNSAAADTPESYKWIKIRGEDGQDGEDGYTPQKDKDYFDGQDGVGIKSVEEFYYAYTKADKLPTNPSWSSTIPSNYGVSRPYLWNYTKTTFTNDDYKSTDPQVISYWSKDGSPGRGIEYIEEYYFLTNTESVPAKNSNGFNTNIKYPSIEMPFLWNYEKIKYTDKDTADETDVKLIGVYGQTGDDGAGIASVTNYYLTNNKASGVTIDGYNWGTTITPVSKEAPYLWNYEEITYTDGRKPTETPPCIIGNYAKDGSNGRGIASVEEQYATSTETGKAPSSFDSSVPELNATNKYLWNRERIKYTDGTCSNWSTPCVIGVFGEDGKTYYTWIKYADDAEGKTNFSDSPTGRKYMGIAVNKSVPEDQSANSNDPTQYKWSLIQGAEGKGVSRVDVEYRLSTSDSSLSSGYSWTTTPYENYIYGTYLWKRYVTYYTDGTFSEGAATLEASWKKASVLDQATEDLNAALAGSLGLNKTVHTDGCTYYHSASTLTGSKAGDTIFKLSAGGFGVSTRGWQGTSDTYYSFGITATGNAVWNILTAHKISADLINAGKIKSIDDAKVQTELNLDTGELIFLLDGYYLRIAAGTTGVDGEQRIGGLSLSQQYGLSSFQTKGFTFTCEELRYMDMMYLYKKANGELPEDSYEAAIVDPYYSEVNPQNIKTKDVHCKEIHIFNDDLGGWYTLSELLMAINDNVTSLSETVCSLQSKVIELENALGQGHEHVYTSSVTSWPTCENAGVRTYSCGCGHSYTESIPALGHIDGDGDAYCDRCGELVGKLKFTATYGASGKTSQDVYHMASGVDGTGTYYGTSSSIEVPDTLFKPLYFYANAGTDRVITQITFSGMQSETKTAAQLFSDGYLSADHRTLNYPFLIINSHGGKSISAKVYFAAESSGGDSGGGDDTTYYTIATSVSPSGAGSVSGGGSYPSGSSVSVTAEPENGYVFSHWNTYNPVYNQTVENVSTDNPWNITATANVTLTAVFTSTSGGSGSSEPTYAVDTIVDGVLYIGTNTTSIARNAYFEHAQSAEITRVVIPFGVTSIGTQAFRGCSNIESIVIPSSVTEIKALAFFDCKKLSDVYYGGSQSSWNSISISTMNNGNSCLTDANIHCNS